VTKVGLAQAETIEKQVAASGGARYQLTRQIAERIAEALEKSGVDIVPRIQVNGGGDEAGGGSGGPLLQALMAMIVSEKGDALLAEEAAKPSRGRKARDESEEEAA